jgi:hypothetical protein
MMMYRRVHLLRVTIQDEGAFHDLMITETTKCHTDLLEIACHVTDIGPDSMKMNKCHTGSVLKNEKIIEIMEAEPK